MTGKFERNQCSQAVSKKSKGDVVRLRNYLIQIGNQSRHGLIQSLAKAGTSAGQLDRAHFNAATQASLPRQIASGIPSCVTKAVQACRSQNSWLPNQPSRGLQNIFSQS